MPLQSAITMALLNYRSKVDLVADQLSDEILSGELPAGTPLKQRDIASRMGVSPTPVREALVRLATQGLVVLEAHCPPTVALQEDERVRENFLVRATLESLAVRLAATRITPADLDVLQSINDELGSLEPNHPSIGAVNLSFHSVLTEAAGVPLLTHLIRQLWAALPMGPQARGRPVSESVRQHQLIIDSLRAGDTAAAVAAIERHIMDAPESLTRPRAAMNSG